MGQVKRKTMKFMKGLKKKTLTIWSCAFCIFITTIVQAQDFKEICADKSKTKGIAVNGMEEWQFLKSELRHLSVDEFWGTNSAKTSMATNPAQRDPFVAIVNYHKALEKENVRLLLVPIPPKAVIYPDKLVAGLEVKRYDIQLQKFYSLLKEQGVEVLDLTSLLLKTRKSVSEPLYCLGDSHLSGEGCKVVAQNIASKLNLKGKNKYRQKEETIQMTGDLYKSTQHAGETRKVYSVSGDQLKETNAPVVLLGDSHTLVYDIGGDLFCQNAGIASLLSSYIGIPLDVVGVRGSGATPARISFFRKSKADKNYLKGKKIIVWCFAAREFTEATSWNPNVPVK